MSGYFVRPALVAILIGFMLLAGCTRNRPDDKPAPQQVGVVPETNKPNQTNVPVENAKHEKGPAPKEAIKIDVVAKQWLWKFQHPDGVREIGELHVCVGQPFQLSVISEDVIHALHIPDLRIKLEAAPGRYTSDWAIAETPGRYAFQCAEYCGALHAKHTGTLVVLDRDDYRIWQLAVSPTDLTTVFKGRQAFLKLQCNVCHSGAVNAKGPNLEKLFGTLIPLKDGGVQKVDEAYVRESIRMPASKVHEGWKPIMPVFDAKMVSDEEIMWLTDYIKSLKPGDLSKKEETPPPKK